MWKHIELLHNHLAGYNNHDNEAIVKILFLCLPIVIDVSFLNGN